MPQSKQDIENYEAGLQQPRFTLRTLFSLIAFCAVALVTFKTAGPMFFWILILAALTMLAHVAGNVLGTQLRDSTDHARRTASVEQRTAASRAQPHHFARTTRLAVRAKLPWPMLVLTALCSLAGAIGGGRFLAEINAPQMNTANLALAYGSCAVLGAILGFGLSMFLKVAVEAWWHANQAD